MQKKHEVNFKMLALNEVGLSSGDSITIKHNTKFNTQSIDVSINNIL